MPFLSGSLSFERFRVENFASETFDQEHLERMQQYVAGRTETSSTENIHTGFLGGAHLFDQDFDLNKNVINEAVHFGVRIDTNQVPSAIKNAWLSMELAALAKDNPSGVPTKAQRKEAKEAVEQRCEVEAATGKYRKFQPYSLLWDIGYEMLYFGGTAGTASGHCADLIELVFQVQLGHVSAGTIALDWATEAGRYAEMDDVVPANFVAHQSHSMVAWANEHSASPDFLGNEFLLWLWWKLENETDTIALPDEQGEVTVMLAKTLSLECPVGENGKETISAECPNKLPEAKQAIQSGKLPRKTGMTIVRDGQQFDLTLQAETFGISGAKIHLDEDDDFGPEDRIDAVRTLCDTVDGMFHSFCDRRTGSHWQEELASMQAWLTPTTKSKRQAA